MDADSYLPLSAREFHVLLAVSQEPLNGYQISQSVEETSNGRSAESSHAIREPPPIGGEGASPGGDGP